MAVTLYGYYLALTLNGNQPVKNLEIQSASDNTANVIIDNHPSFRKISTVIAKVAEKAHGGNVEQQICKQNKRTC